MHSLNGTTPKSNSGNGIDGGEIFIHRLDRKTNFTKIDNGIRGSGLSLAAIGLHTVLQTLPQGWRIDCDHIMRETHTGERPFWRHWKELKRAGFIVVRRPRLPNGRFGKPEIHVYPVPHQSLRNAHSGETRVCEIHTLENVNYKNKDETVIKTEQVERPERKKDEESAARILKFPVEHTGRQSESSSESESGRTAQPTDPNSVNGGGPASKRRLTAAEVEAHLGKLFFGGHGTGVPYIPLVELMEPYRARFPHVDLTQFQNVLCDVRDRKMTLETALAKRDADGRRQHTGGQRPSLLSRA